MQPIPLSHRREINDDPYFRTSCLSGNGPRSGDPIVIHHAWEYAGRQISEMWCYCPLLESEHSPYSNTPSAHNDKKVNDRVKLIALQRTNLDDLKKRFPKKDWDGEIRRIKFNLTR